MAARSNGAKQGPIKQTDREQYRALISDDAEWRRPTPPTANKICDLLDVDPFAFRAPRVLDSADAAKSFVVALDHVIQLGDRGPDGEESAQLLWNGIFDAVARHWSVSYRDAQQRGAFVTYNMTKSTIRAAWREMKWAGFDLEAIWEQLVKPTGALALLYTVGRVSGKGHARGRRVKLIEGPLLDEVRYAILQDRQYARPDRRRVLLADEDAPPLPPRQAVSEERPYETVALGEQSRRVLSMLEATRVWFYVETFRQDYEARPDPAWRPIYEQTAGLVPKREIGFEGPGRGYVEIKSRFFRAVNRRFHAADFWPEHVPDALRARWFGLAPRMPELDKHGPPVQIGEVIKALQVRDALAPAFVERDISSSQTQLLAVFLNEPFLEELACDPTKKFKVWLAEQLWSLHERENILAPGYEAERVGPAKDDRLITFIKELWMRRNYGGKFSQTVRDLAEPGNRTTYGPGWNVDVFKTGGVKLAEQYWRLFLASLPAWERTVSKFLDACQYLGREADWDYGIRFDDPLDGAEVQWSPIRLATDRVPTGKRHIEVLRPGVTIRRRAEDGRYVRRFLWRDPYVDSARLANRVAPCVVHTLDAFFNALVLMDLHWEGETNVVAIHDSWFVPAVHLVPESGFTQHWPGSRLVEGGIRYAGRLWLEGIGSVYGWFVDATLGTPYRRFARELRRAWCKRVVEQRWPRFTAS